MHIPETGNAAAVVAQRIRETLQGDAQPQRNLASFVTTWMEEEAEQLACESLSKNLINTAEYPETEAIQQRVVNMIASLFHARPPSAGQSSGFPGTTTVGSSEAIMLALLAHKWNWKKRHAQNPRRSGKDRPYLVIGTHTHACFAKFARYFDVGVIWISLEPGQYAITATQVQAVLEGKLVDDAQVMEDCGYTREQAGERRVGELIMAVGCVVCTTFTADMDDVAGIDRALAAGGWDIPIHVDAASGGFVLPFSGADDLLWDFRLPHVQSINVSNHKYGLVYAGLGTVVFRDDTIVPQELLMDIDYLSGDMRNYSLNFSRPSSGVVLQYYNFLRLGKAGYRRLIRGCLEHTRHIARAFQTVPELAPYFDVISKTDYFPVVVVRFKDGGTQHPPFKLQALAQALKNKGWMVPVYRLPANAEAVEVMRIVVRPDVTGTLTEALIGDLKAAVQQLCEGNPAVHQRLPVHRSAASAPHDLAVIRNFFNRDTTPVYYFSTTPFNLLTAGPWINNLRFINTIDTFDGQHPNAFVPPDARSHSVPGFEAANNYLLQHPAVAELVRQGGRPGAALFLMFDEQTERLARHLGLRVCFPPAALRRYLDNKVTTTRLANRAGVPSVPNVLARVDSYAGLRRAALGLGPDLVVQLPHGDSGKTTFFISAEADFHSCARQIAAQPAVKIMRRIRCRPLTIEGCVTRHGTLAGPLMTEMIGYSELTPYRGGWCGNEVFADGVSAALTPEIRRQALTATVAIGEQIRQSGYWGCFGVDFLLDQETGALYLGELNPRLTGTTSLTTQLASEPDQVPLLLFHLLEGFGVEYRVDVAQFNQRWLKAEQIRTWSQMILDHTLDTRDAVTQAPPSGIWRLGSDGAVHFVRPAFHPQSISSDDEAFFIRTVDAGQTVSKGDGLGRLICRGRMTTDDNPLAPLTQRAQAWSRGLRARFAPCAIPHAQYSSVPPLMRERS